jgi:hypothetical protein
MPERGEEGVDGLFLGPAGKSLIETVRALEDGLRSGEAGAGEDDRGHPGMGRPARMQALGPRASARYSMIPPAWLPQMPKAWTSWSSVRW